MTTLIEFEAQARVQMQEEEERHLASLEAKKSRQAAMIEGVIKPQAVTLLAQRYDLDEADLGQAVAIENIEWFEFAGDGRFVRFSVALALPEHDVIAMRDCYADRSGEEVEVALNNHPHPWFGENAYCSLSQALILASENWKLGEKNMLVEDELATLAEARHQKQEEKAELEKQERGELVDFLSSDPAAFYLLRAFAEIVRQREAYDEQLGNADLAMDDLRASYERDLNAATERARKLERDAREERGKREEAEDEIEQMRRKARRSGV